MEKHGEKETKKESAVASPSDILPERNVLFDVTHHVQFLTELSQTFGMQHLCYKRIFMFCFDDLSPLLYKQSKDRLKEKLINPNNFQQIKDVIHTIDTMRRNRHVRIEHFADTSDIIITNEAFANAPGVILTQGEFYLNPFSQYVTDKNKFQRFNYSSLAPNLIKEPQKTQTEIYLSLFDDLPTRLISPKTYFGKIVESEVLREPIRTAVDNYILKR
jgi:hypothetical protein